MKRWEERVVSTHDGVKVGFHELFVEIHLVKVPIRTKDYVHVIQASDLHPNTKEEESELPIMAL